MEYTGWSKDIKVFEYKGPEKYYEQLAIEFLENAQKAIAEKGSFLAVLGGGRTPRHINAKIVELSAKYNVDWSRVYIVLSDERWIEETDDYSNYKMMQETLIVPLGINSLHHIFESEITLEHAAEKYAGYLEELWEKTEQRIFDYALLGVGNDGHTASLFPERLFSSESSQMVVCGGKGPEGLERISLSYEALNKCNLVSFIVNSLGKREILHLMRMEWNPEKYPIQNINTSKNMHVLAV